MIFLHHHPSTGLADRSPRRPRTTGRPAPTSQRDRVAASLLVRPETAEVFDRPLSWPRL